MTYDAEALVVVVVVVVVVLRRHGEVSIYLKNTKKRERTAWRQQGRDSKLASWSKA